MPAPILVVDDDPLTCELICEILRSAGWAADAVTDSTEAAALLRSEKFHAVFLDLRMPAPDGLELIRQIRSSPLNGSAVIAMITGEEDRNVLGRIFQAGAHFCLFKPIERGNLLRLIRATQGPIERERRRFTRVKLPCKVSLEWGEERLEGTTLDLSLSGLLVQAGRAFPVGSAVQVSLELMPAAPRLHTAARVVRTVGVDCMGIRFESLDAGEAQRLQQFLLPKILAATAEPPEKRRVS